MKIFTARSGPRNFLINCISVLLIFFPGGRLWAQQGDAISELHKIAAVYSEDATYSMNIAVKYFYPYESNSLTDTLRISMIMNKSAFYYKMGNVECLCHDGYYLQVDNGDRKIYLSETSTNNTPYNIQLLDSMVTAFHAKGIISSEGAGMKTITLYLPGSTMPEMRITYNPGNYTLVKSVIKYVEQINPKDFSPASVARVEMEYHNVKKSEKPFPSGQYPFSKYFTLNGKQVSLSSNYRNYQLNNFLKP